MKKWRLISYCEDNAAMQMAIDEALLISKSVNTLRFYSWYPPAISIGFFQSVNQEVDLDKLKQYQFDIVRRYTGGGAVFHDQEITYSVLLSEDDLDKDILKSYEEICGAVICGFKELEIDCQFKPINDIMVNGKKISGSAQTRRNKMVLQHGTVLVDVDVAKMFSILKVPDEKLRDKMINDVSECVTSIKNELNREVAYSEVVEALKKGFMEKFQIEFCESNLTDEEKNLARKLYDEKYNTSEWLNQR